MRDLDVKGIHIAERDTQVGATPRARDSFVNTWSMESFISEGFRPAKPGWGTYEDCMPEDAHRFDGERHAAT